jgi:pimeloyl-ACP methyl ester carboxylesterase
MGQSPKKKKSYIRLWSLLLFVIMVFLTAGSVYQAAAEFVDARIRPMPGELFELESYKLHLDCTGSGEPVVILESDLGYPGLQWAQVQKAMARVTRVCSYDRASMGWSEASLLPRRGDEMSEELNRLVDAANLDGPFVLVGTGYGSWLTRLYADRYPEKTAAIVLVNPPEEPYPGEQPQVANLLYYRWMPLPTWLGVTRLTGVLGGMDRFTLPAANFSVDKRKAFLAVTAYRTRYWSDARMELEAVPEIYADLLKFGELNDVPLVVLGNPEANYPGSASLDSLEKLAGLSSQGLVFLCSTCTADVPMSNADEVASAIMAAVEQVKP